MEEPNPVDPFIAASPAWNTPPCANCGSPDHAAAACFGVTPVRASLRLQDLDELQGLVAQAEGEDPHATLGPTPWSIEVAAPWEKRHGHDVRLACWKVEGCQIIEAAHEQAVEALPHLIAELRILRRLATAAQIQPEATLAPPVILELQDYSKTFPEAP